MHDVSLCARFGRAPRKKNLRAQNILTARTVNDFAITFPNGEASAADRGDEIVIEVSAPTATNSPLAGQWLANRTLTARIVMVKE